jgi:hypothetical protein
MTWLWEILVQTARTVWAHKLRSALTMFGIAWGIAAIIFMMAIGDGFKIGVVAPPTRRATNGLVGRSISATRTWRRSGKSAT